MSPTGNEERSVSVFIIAAVAMMIISLVMLSAVASSALDQMAVLAPAMQLDASAIRLRTMAIFVTTTAVISATLLYLGSSLAAITRRVRRSEAEFRALFTTTGDALLLLDPTTLRVRNANEAACRLLGRSNATLVASSLTVHTAPGDAAACRECLQAAAAGAPSVYQEATMMAAGREVPVLLTASASGESPEAHLQVRMTDLSAQKAAEEERMREYRQLLAIFDSIDEAVYVADPETYEVLYANRAIRARCGDVVGRTCYEALEQRDEPCPFCTNDRILGDDLGRACVWERHDEATDTWYRCIDKAIPWPDGRTVRYEMALDITELRRTQEELGQRTNGIEAAIDGIAVLDENKRYIYLNQAHAEVYGYDSAEELMGETWRVLYEDDELARFEAEIMPELMSAGRWRGETVGLRRDGTTFPQELSLTALDDGGLVSVVRDITDRKRAEEELSRSRERYRELANSLPQVVFETDARGRLTFVNRAAFDFFGYPRDELERAPTVLQMIAPQDRLRAARTLRARLSGEDTQEQGEYQMRRADGSTFPAAVYASPVIRDGEIAGMRGLVLDVTERQEREQQLHERLLFEKAVSAASALLVGEGEADLDAMLRAIGEATDVSRTYIFRFTEDLSQMSNTHEWCAPGVEPEIDMLQDLDTADFAWWMERLSAGEDIVVADVCAMPEEAESEREILQAQDIHSVIVVPIESASGELVGYLGADETSRQRGWQSEEGRLLRLIAQRLAIYWQRHEAQQELRLTNTRLELLQAMSQRLNTGASLDEVVQEGCEALKELLGYRYVELFLPGEDCDENNTDRLEVMTSAEGLNRRAVRTIQGPLVSRTRTGRVYDENRLVEFVGREEILPLIVDLAPPGETAMDDLAPRIYEILGVEYMCQLPLLCEGEPIGHLAVGKADTASLRDREKRFLEQFAEQLGLLIAKSRTEEALRRSESRYRLLFNSGNDAMYVHRLPAEGLPRNFLEVNDVACEMLGYSRDELLEMSAMDLEPPGGACDMQTLRHELAKEGHTLHETVHVARDGTRIPVEISSHLFEMDGRPTVLSITRDVTERRRFERRLRQVNECFLSFGPEPMENIERLVGLCGEVLGADWAAYVRRDGQKLRAVSGWHIPEGFEPPADSSGLVCDDMMGAETSDVVGLTGLDASPYAETDPAVRDFGARSYLGKVVRPHAGTVGSICTFYRGDYEASEEDEQLIGIIAAAIRVEEERRHVHDERERAVADLRTLNRDLEMARREAEEANRLKSEFLANTSHEIRTPLNGIIGYLQLVLNDLCDDREEEREFIAGAHESAEHLLALINDVLDVAKIEAGKLRVEPEAVNVAEVLANIHSLVRVQAEQNGLELVFHPVAHDLAAWCDEERLKQVLVNLIGNAVKFTPEGGTVTVDVTARDEEGAIRFEVTDTGIGIEPDRIEAVFEKFVQADGSTTRERGGSGLGLTISRRLVELMGGAIGAHSEGEGCGSTFHFTIPLHRSDVERDWDAPLLSVPDTLDPDRCLVLVVEDDPVYREYLCDLLSAVGSQTMWAATADDAMVVLDEHVPCAITLDYSLPAREGARLNTGWDLLVALQKDERFDRTAVILVTGDTDVIQRKIVSDRLPDRVKVIDKMDVQTDLTTSIDQVITTANHVPPRPLHILLADDDAAFHRVVERMLEGRGYQLHHAPDGMECLDYLRDHAEDVDLLLLDLRMPGLDGYDVLRDLRRSGDGVDLPVLVVTAYPEPKSFEQRMLLASGGRTRMLTKHQVLTDPSRFRALLELQLRRFSVRPTDTGGSTDTEEAPPKAA